MSEVKVIRLSTGEDVIAKVDRGADYVTLEKPFVIIPQQLGPGKPVQLMMSLYNAFGKGDKVEVAKDNVIRDTEKLSVDMPVGYTLMEAAKELDLPEIPADCGGCQACGTCHIHVDDVWCDKLKIKENSLEQDLLEYEKNYVEGKSRLA